MEAKDFRLDYFQIYNFENPQDVRGITPTIQLRGQFDEDGPEFAKLQYLKKIANPVQKYREDIYNRRGHLVWYNMRSSDVPTAIGVKLENQFGKQKIVIYGDVGLLVPAQKRKMPRGKFSKPTKLDHYKIYRVVDHSPVENVDLELKDQFHKRKAKLGYAVAFAVPVEKVHAGREFPIINEKAHLTIYRIAYSKDMPQMVETRDQFNRYRYLKIGRSYLLAAPSEKLDWKVLD